MASLVPGFEYDIFISYRHKDNRYDGWVTEFVSHLKKELEATFKDEITVYFDENPTDGLLETHDVDQSLKGKLKCLIFIPIISQTYCDPKSFAWRHEFQVFNKLAKEDTYGRDIKLGNGNVSSRILPVRIHELDQEDLSMLEAELGGVLRSVEFIFKSAGVNRPLKSDDDRKENLNRTYYRDQINKVANAIKEIITAIRNPSRIQAQPRKEVVVPAKRRIGRRLLAITSAGILVLLLAGYITYFLYTKNLDRSVAVVPFADLSQAHDQEWFCDGMTEEILSHLSRINGLRVISRTSCMTYKGTKKAAKEIAQELGVTHILEGSIRNSADRIRVTVQLIDAVKDEHIWAKDYDFTDLKDALSLQKSVSTNVAQLLKGSLTQEDKESLSKTNTDNPAAIELYLKGRSFWDMRTAQSYDSAEYYYKYALELDPNYALAYAGLADCYTLGQQGMSTVEEIEVAKIYLTKALALDSNLCEAITTKGFIESHIEYEWEKGEKTLARAIDINPNYSIARLYHGNIKIFTGRSINEGLEEVKKGLQLDPLSPSVNWAVGSRYVSLELNESAVKQFRKTLAIDPGHIQAVIGMAYSLVRLQKYDEALDAINNTQALPAFYRDIFIALSYAERGETAKAKAQLEKLPAVLPRRGPPKPLVRTYIDLKDYDAAITMLEDQYKERSLNNLGLKTDPSYDPLRGLPRFKALLRKMNFE